MLFTTHLQEVGFKIPAIRLLLADVQMAGCQLSGLVVGMQRCGQVSVFMPSLRAAFRFPAAHRFDSRANSLHNDAENLSPSGRQFGAELVSAPSPAVHRGRTEAVYVRAQASVQLRTNHHPVC